MDLQADENSPIEGLEDKILLAKAIDSLKGQQQRILKLRFNEGKTQTDQRVAPIPDGATGWHSRVVQVA